MLLVQMDCPFIICINTKFHLLKPILFCLMQRKFHQAASNSHSPVISVNRNSYIRPMLIFQMVLDYTHFCLTNNLPIVNCNNLKMDWMVLNFLDSFHFPFDIVEKLLRIEGCKISFLRNRTLMLIKCFCIFFFHSSIYYLISGFTRNHTLAYIHISTS